MAVRERRRALPEPRSARERVPLKRKVLAWAFAIMMLASVLTAMVLAFTGQ